MDSEIHNTRQQKVERHRTRNLKTNIPSYFENIESIQPSRGQKMDAAENSGFLVESTIKIFPGTQGGRSNYTINLYHTNNSMMVNGKMAVQFNDGHAKITESIMASDQVSQLYQDICAKIVEGFGGNFSVQTSKNNTSCCSYWCGHFYECSCQFERFIIQGEQCRYLAVGEKHKGALS